MARRRRPIPIRTANGPRVMASLRNLAITILRLTLDTPASPLPCVTLPAGPAGRCKRSSVANGRLCRALVVGHAERDRDEAAFGNANAGFHLQDRPAHDLPDGHRGVSRFSGGGR